MTNSYSLLTPDELEEHLSNYLIESWSYSKLATFSRNEKAFEKIYIYNEYSKKSATSQAGSAYHEALKFYFKNFKGSRPGIVVLQKVAYDYIDKICADDWKLSKECPTVAESIAKAYKTVATLLTSFLEEIEVYAAHIAHIYSVEASITDWVCVNGVDIPLPLKAIADLVIRTHDGKIVVIDHKSVISYSTEEERALTGGKQAITYALAVEKQFPIKVDEVWFIENKSSKNKDKSPQLRVFKVELNTDNRRLYEALVYQHLKRVTEAVSDPNYIYTINDSDKFEDIPALYDFWMRTLIVDVDEFEIPDDRKDLLRKREKKTIDASVAQISPKVIAEFRRNAAAFIVMDYSMSNMTSSEKIEHKLRSFGFKVEVAEVIDGYSSDTYLLNVASGQRIDDINRYKLDIASALGVSQVIISPQLRVHNGQAYAMINVTKKRERNLLFDPAALVGRKLPLGKDNFEELVVWDLDNHATPHILVCGATGSGKSVAINSTVAYALLAGIKDIIIFDPKYEFGDLEGKGVKVFSDIDDIEDQMAILVKDMQMRSRTKVSRTTLVVFDEFADALAQSRKGKALGGDKSLVEMMQMLMQKGRSLGFRFMVATQRASVKTIPGDIKVNLPVQLCFRVPKPIDSVVVLGEEGAEGLAGYGDGLINSPEYLGIQRFQGYYKP